MQIFSHIFSWSGPLLLAAVIVGAVYFFYRNLQKETQSRRWQ